MLGPDTCPCCHPRGTWWLSAHTRASCRSGAFAAGKKLSMLEGHTARVGEATWGQGVGVCCGARPHPQPALHLATGNFGLER